jgi:hypothetical protein
MSVVLAALVTMVLVPARAHAFAPKHHEEMILQQLDYAGFSEGEVWLLAYFSLEVDVATESPDVFCWWPIRWPTRQYVCEPAHDQGNYDPCTGGGAFADWAGWCVPFHNCRLCYPIKDSKGVAVGWNGGPVKGLEAFTKMWSLPSVEDALHMAPGDRCYDVLREFGHALHGIQDFYAHSNWVEVFHTQLGFDFQDIPTWTSFQEAQRGETLNLILKQHFGDETTAKEKYATLDTSLQEGGDDWHATYNKDSDDTDVYSAADVAAHQDSDGHTILDFHEAAKKLAATETYQLGLQFKANIVNNPKLGDAAWKNLFYCVSEMATYDGKSYEDELAVYKKGIGRLKFYSSNMQQLCALIAPVALPFIAPLIPFAIGPSVVALCKLAPHQAWH